MNSEKSSVNGQRTPASYAIQRESKRSGDVPFTAISRSRFTVRCSRSSGFTLIELIVVMAIIALLLSLAVPRYFHSADRAKEAVLRQNLAHMREAIDKYYADQGRYPDSLEDLALRKYLRKVPPDPITDSITSWVIVPPDNAGKGSVFDVRSGATGNGLDGSAYDRW